jgi:chemotaxis protein MotA
VLIIVGFVVVIGAVLGGFLMAGGSLLVLVQPSEFVVIGGAAAGSLLISTPPKTVKMLIKQITGAFGSGPSQADYVDLLAMQYQIFKLIQQSGVMALEAHFEDPRRARCSAAIPSSWRATRRWTFLADSAKVIIVGGIAAHDLGSADGRGPARAPRGRAQAVGHAQHDRRRAAGPRYRRPPCSASSSRWATSTRRRPRSATTSAPALVGTFLGILMSYGFVAPLAGNLAQRVNEEQYYCLCIKAGCCAVYKGHPPTIAIEFARRALPHDVRPSFNETEQFCRAAASGKAEEAAAA